MVAVFGIFGYIHLIEGDTGDCADAFVPHTIYNSTKLLLLLFYGCGRMEKVYFAHLPVNEISIQWGVGGIVYSRIEGPPEER